MDKAEFMKIWWAQNQSEPVPPDNEVWYWAPEKVTLYTTAGVVEHTFADGKGVLKFASAVTEAQSWFRTTAVTDVRLPDSVAIIREYAFSGCSSLALTALPSGVTSIWQNAFYLCTSLALTELPSGVASIGNYTFCSCFKTGTRSLTFLGTPVSIDGAAFGGNPALRDIYVPWAEGEVANAPWGATAATIHFNHTP